MPIDRDRTLAGSSLSALLLPASLKDFLTERLDALGQVKRLAQVASIFGRQFEFDDLHFLSGVSREALLDGLSKLETAGVIRQQMRPNGATFAFKHAMIEEAAYASMLKEERRDLHARAAARLGAPSPNRDSSQLAVLAHHYSCAGMLSEAINSWLAAGHAAMQRSAYKEVIANLSEGVELVLKLPASPDRSEMEIALHSHLGMAYAALGGWWHPRADRAYVRALDLSRTLGSVREKSIVLWGMTIAKLVNCELPMANDYAREFMDLAALSGDRETELMAHTATLLVNFFLGRLLEAQVAANFVIGRYDPGEHSKLVQIYQHDPKIVALVYAGRIEWLLGNPTRARSYSEKARSLARELNHPFMLAFALILGACDHLFEGEHAANLECVEEGLAQAKEYSLPLYEVFGPLWAIPAFANRDPSPAVLEDLSNNLNMLLDNKYYLQAGLYQNHLAIELCSRSAPWTRPTPSFVPPKALRGRRANAGSSRKCIAFGRNCLPGTRRPGRARQPNTSNAHSTARDPSARWDGSFGPRWAPRIFSLLEGGRGRRSMVWPACAESSLPKNRPRICGRPTSHCRRSARRREPDLRVAGSGRDHVHPPPDVERGAVDSEPHPVETAERPMLWQAMPRAERHLFAIVALSRAVEVLHRNLDPRERDLPVPRAAQGKLASSTSSGVGASRIRTAKSNTAFSSRECVSGSSSATIAARRKSSFGRPRSIRGGASARAPGWPDSERPCRRPADMASLNDK